MYVAVLIGQQMRISASTTIWHRRNSYKHCNVRDQAYLVIPMYLCILKENFSCAGDCL